MFVLLLVVHCWQQLLIICPSLSPPSALCATQLKCEQQHWVEALLVLVKMEVMAAEMVRITMLIVGQSVAAQPLSTIDALQRITSPQQK